MPIRLNLLAEAQALEELRRRDPVKRAIWVGVALVIVLLAWSSSLQLKAILAKGSVAHVEGLIASRTNEYQRVVANQQKLGEINERLGALQQLATNRLLYGSLLDALQHTTVDNVQLMHFKADQAFVLSEAVKPKTNSTHVVPGRPASVTERVVLTLEAKDSGPNPGDEVNRFKQAILNSSYFRAALNKSNEIRLASLSPPQQTADNKPFVLFTLECRFADKTR